MLSQRGRYALKALLNIARDNTRPRQVSAIGLEENIPRKFLEGIMSDLRRAEIVESAKGRQGGYRLGRPADRITFGEIMRVTDGPLALLPCASRAFFKPCDDCPDVGECTLRNVLITVRNEVSDVLDRMTLADAIAGGGRLPDHRAADSAEA